MSKVLAPLADGFEGVDGGARRHGQPRGHPGYGTARMAAYAAATVLASLVALPRAAAEDAAQESEKQRFRLVRLVEGLENPWGMAFLPGGGFLITERPGRLQLVSPQTMRPEPVTGLPEVSASGQGGLLDVALHPHFQQNRLVYISYSAGGLIGKGTEVARGRLLGQQLEDLEVIFQAQPKQFGSRHFGSRLLFSPDGMLFISLGDRADRPSAQDLGQHPGSIIRVQDDGSVPETNPFVRRQLALPEIYSYGHRNVQGIFWQQDADLLWTHEHGPMGGDELNLVQAGRNYGWPVITYGVNYGTGTAIGEGITHQEGMEQPKYYWVPSISPSGLLLYTGERFPDWRGNLFIGSLKFSLLVRLELRGEEVVREERLLQGKVGRVRDVRQGPDGLIYLLTDESRGMLARLEPVAPDE